MINVSHASCFFLVYNILSSLNYDNANARVLAMGTIELVHLYFIAHCRDNNNYKNYTFCHVQCINMYSKSSINKNWRILNVNWNFRAWLYLTLYVQYMHSVRWRIVVFKTCWLSKKKLRRINIESRQWLIFLLLEISKGIPNPILYFPSND